MIRQSIFVGALVIALLGLAHAQNSGTFPQGSGGGGTPGSPSLSVQYNNAGSFGGMAGTSWENTGQSLTMGTATVLASEPILNLSQTWNNLTTTAASGTGTTATISFAAQPVAIAVGSLITVAGVTPSGYNATSVAVTASTTSSVSYANATTGAQTVAGTVTSQFTGFKFNVVNTNSLTGSLIANWSVGGTSEFQVTPLGEILAADGTNLKMLTWGGDNKRGVRAGSGGIELWDANAALGLATSSGSVSLGAETTTFNWPAGSNQGVALLKEQANGTEVDLAWANVAHPQGIRLYNTRDSGTGLPTNYERGIMDWNSATNVFTIGTQSGGTGSNRQLQLVANGGTFIRNTTASTPAVGFDFGNAGSVSYTFGPRGSGTAYTAGNTFSFANGAGSSTGLVLGTGGVTTQAFYGFSTSAFGEVPDLSLARVAAKVSSFGDGAANANGWYQWGGQARVTADVTQTSTTALANVAGLTVNVAAGRTYSFEADLSWTDAAAGGIQAAIAGTATATNIIYDGWVIDSGANGIKGNAQATALGTAVANTTTTGTAGHLTISGTITVNAAGTLTVQSAQNTSNATSTTIKRGSRFLVYDMP